ncbi:hypothetical protein V501_09342, partial [Pseudogymnoascus sp. VKM F-4519 (FW-2642)]
ATGAGLLGSAIRRHNPGDGADHHAPAGPAVFPRRAGAWRGCESDDRAVWECAALPGLGGGGGADGEGEETEVVVGED